MEEAFRTQYNGLSLAEGVIRVSERIRGVSWAEEIMISV